MHLLSTKPTSTTHWILKFSKKKKLQNENNYSSLESIIESYFFSLSYSYIFHENQLYVSVILAKVKEDIMTVSKETEKSTDKLTKSVQNFQNSKECRKVGKE